MNPRLRQNWRRKSLSTQAGVYKRQMWITLPTQYIMREVGQLKINTNNVTCHLVMKHFDMFDQTPSHILEKIVAKHTELVKKQSQSLTLGPNIKVIVKNER